MDPSVASQFRMERRGKEIALADGDDPTGGGLRAQGNSRRAQFLDPRRPDEDAAHGTALDPPDGDVLLEGVHLPPEGVAPHRHVNAAEGLLERVTAVVHP